MFMLFFAPITETTLPIRTLFMLNYTFVNMVSCMFLFPCKIYRNLKRCKTVETNCDCPDYPHCNLHIYCIYTRKTRVSLCPSPKYLMFISIVEINNHSH